MLWLEEFIPERCEWLEATRPIGGITGKLGDVVEKVVVPFLETVVEVSHRRCVALQ